MKRPLALLAAIVLASLALAPGASAFKVLSQPGEGAGQTDEPNGLALDPVSSALYVADQANRRIDVFDAAGDFQKAFGWGVKDGGSEFQSCTAKCRKGLAGTGNGQFDQPVAVAVDGDPASSSYRDLYAYDFGNERIEKFDRDGNFLLSFGSGEGQFKEFLTRLATGPGGTLYVADKVREEGNPKTRLQRFDPTGAPLGPGLVLQGGLEPESLAVDSSGDFYVASGPPIRKYEPGNPVPVGEFEVPLGAGESGGAQRIAVDSSDHLFVSTAQSGFGDELNKSRIAEYDAAGNPVRRFGYGSFQTFAYALAPYRSAAGDIYAAEYGGSGGLGGRVVHIDYPPPGPVVVPEPCKAGPLGNTKATLTAYVNPEGNPTTYAFQYVDEKSFEEEGGFASPATQSTPPSDPTDPDFVLHEASAEVDLIPSTAYRCRVVATNADAPGGTDGQTGAFTALDPLEIDSTWASDVGIDAATLNAAVNPLQIPTAGHFEYVGEATYQEDIAALGPEHGFDHATRAPAGEEIDFGAGNSPKAGSATIAGLVPGTAYRYRVVATDPLIAPEEVAGPAKVLRTFAPPPAAPVLPDGRAWELVSPAQKNNGEVGVPGPGLGGLRSYDEYNLIQAASGSGEALTYTAFASFAEPQGAPPTNQYLSRRGPGGWQTANPSPTGSQKLFIPPFRGFSADLRYGAMVASLPQAEGATEGVDNLYLRDNASGELRVLTVGAPDVQSPELCLDYAGVSADGSRAFFAARGSYAGAPQGKGSSLYEWSEGEGLRVVSVLPSGAPAAPAEKTGFGTGADCQTGVGVAHNVVSADGSRAFWTYAPTGEASQLLVRVDGEKTFQLDKKVTGGSGEPGNGFFWAASADGSKSFFTSASKLTAGSGAVAGKPDLYRYELPGKTLTDLTAGASPAGVEGVVGTSEDGAYVYFVATGTLAAGAVAGEHNLYLYHEGEGTRFIASLATGTDQGVWESRPRVKTARVSPDGRHLAFLSTEAESLAGYDNRIAGGEHCQLSDPLHAPFKGISLVGDPHCPQAFVYDAGSEELTCASCNPSGARPAGPAILPGWSNPYEGMRYLSDDGSRLFFESFDALALRDGNQKRDAYEWEAPGTGTCTPSRPEYSPLDRGCLNLVSSGTSSDESYLVDASADGRDVFFATRQALAGWDTNDNYDIYDLRAGGGFPEPPPIAEECEGEGCKPPLPAPPAPFAPATAGFSGPGNPKPEKQHRKKHKKSKHHKRQHEAKRDRGGRR